MKNLWERCLHPMPGHPIPSPESLLCRECGKSCHGNRLWCSRECASVGIAKEPHLSCWGRRQLQEKGAVSG